MRTTALHDLHAAAGARFAPFAGYDMPIQYPLGALEEHRLTRRSVGLFDIDHMGQIIVDGKGSGEALSALVSNRILDMAVSQARYALLLNEEGGILDDLFIYRIGAERWFVVVNASNRETDYARLRGLIRPPATVADVSEETYMIAVQGPRAVELMDALSGGAVSPMPRFSAADARVAGIPARVGRTGYTGEDGVEIFYPADRAAELWETLLRRAGELGIEAAPIGLAARDSLRFEAGMPLHGHEISPSITPLEAALSWACDFEKDFVGRDALLKQKAAGVSRKLVALSVSGGVPREGYEATDAAGKKIGGCVAGMFCPTVGLYAANAFVAPEAAKIGTALKVVIRGSGKDAVVVKRPLYVPAYRR
jgi:glycine cleavage system T protein